MILTIFLDSKLCFYVNTILIALILYLYYLLLLEKIICKILIFEFNLILTCWSSDWKKIIFTCKQKSFKYLFVSKSLYLCSYSSLSVLYQILIKFKYLYNTIQNSHFYCLSKRALQMTQFKFPICEFIFKRVIFLYRFSENREKSPLKLGRLFSGSHFSFVFRQVFYCLVLFKNLFN